MDDERLDNLVMALRLVAAATLARASLEVAGRIAAKGYDFDNARQQARDMMADELQRMYGMVSDADVFEGITRRVGRGGMRR